MFIKQIKKKNKNSDKEYIYYRLVHTYKIGNKPRHQNILNLGKLEQLPRNLHKALADRIEEILTGNTSLFTDNESVKEVEVLAQEFSEKIIKEKLFTRKPSKRSISKEIENNYQEVDLESIEELESKDIGAEWLVKQAFTSLGIEEILLEAGLSSQQCDIAQLLLTAKLIHPSSELETERWLAENSAGPELYPSTEAITRYKLYQAASKMYENKENIDKSIYDKVSDIFSNRSKIVIYDLTNMYFEGQMLGSEKAAFGRSKQKKSGNKLIGLAISIDSLAFIRSNEIYPGNVSEPGTFKDLIVSIKEQMNAQETPLVIMDAGIGTEDNLEMLRDLNYDYISVSRTKPKDYTLIGATEQTSDNRANIIELTKASVEGKKDNYMHIKSHQKYAKEASMNQKLSKRLEDQFQQIKDNLPKKGALKKIVKVHEKVGRIKAKLSRVAWLYEVGYTEDKDKGIITDMRWKRIKEREKPKGEYFLRYTQNAISEKDIWQGYNQTRDVEAVFRCLKSDLDIRPIHHQKDKYIEPHIWLSLLAYQIVNYITVKLHHKNINYSWSTIVEKMSSMQSSIVCVDNNKNQKIYIKLCTRPTQTQKNIFDALHFKHRPFVRKTKVVP